MMRTLFTIGCIAGFIACAFVPPTDANFQSLEQMAKTQVRERTASSLLGGKTLDSKQVENAANILKAVVADPALRSAVQKAAGKATDVSTVEDIVTAISAMASPKRVLKRASTVAVHAVQTHRFSATWTKTKVSSTKERVLQMQRIEWASRKQDVRLCGEVKGDVETTVGEYIALCVALVTGDPSRCDQLRETKNMCTNELAS